MNNNEYNFVIGQEVWVCDYRLNSDKRLEKPIRHVKPTLVRVVGNEETRETVYYSEYHFRPLNKSGGILKKVIKPYDNTGFRSFTGVSLNIFFTEKECREYYKQQCLQIKKELKEQLERTKKHIGSELIKIDKLIEREGK